MISKELYLLVLAFFVSFTLQANILESLPEISAKSTASISNDIDAFSQRNRVVKYNPNYFFSQPQAKNSSGNPPVKTIQPQLQLNLFDDLSINAVAKNVYTREDGKTVWLGYISDQLNSSVNIIADQQHFTANIRTKGQTFQIRTQPNGQLLVNHFANPYILGTDVITRSLKAQAQSQQQSRSNSAMTQKQNTELPIYSNIVNGFSNNADIKVLVYYTNQALADIPDLLNIIDLEFIETNQAFANSDINASVSIAVKIAIDESPISGGLAFEELSQKKGPFTNVDEVRAKYQADLVHFYPRRLKGVCGSAFKAAYPEGWAIRGSGYAATSVFCTGILTTAHELGHNFGAAHDSYTEERRADNSNYGYVDIENQFKTIMAYTTECDEKDIFCENISHFSNPNQAYNGLPTGIAEPIDEATDNSKQINYSALSLANFYGVNTPNITTISQGDNTQGVALTWDTVVNATGYQVTRRNADIDEINGPLCSYPLHGEEFIIEATEFVDINATSGVTYCYSITALNDELLDDVTSPESFVRTGYFHNDSTHVLPFIDNITLEYDATVFEAKLILPDDFDYQLKLVEYSSELLPSLQLLVAEDAHTIQISDIEQVNQTFTLALIATHKVTNEILAQQFNAFSSNFENQQPSLLIESKLLVDQQSTTQLAITVADNQDIAEDGVYAYSRNEDIISEAWISQDENKQFILNVQHKGLKIGQAEVVVGYSDGEYIAESVVTVTEVSPRNKQV